MNVQDALAVLLPVAGGLLQFFVRQFQKVPELVYHLIAFGLALGVYGLVTDNPFAGGTRAGILAVILWMAQHLPAVWGGTFVVSNVAKTVSADAAKGNLFIPLTNSK